jgi:hypothetical protein
MSTRFRPLRDDRVATMSFTHRASRTVVADAITFAPAAFTRCSSAGSGRPK